MPMKNAIVLPARLDILGLPQPCQRIKIMDDLKYPAALIATYRFPRP